MLQKYTMADHCYLLFLSGPQPKTQPILMLIYLRLLLNWKWWEMIFLPFHEVDSSGYDFINSLSSVRFPQTVVFTFHLDKIGDLSLSEEKFPFIYTVGKKSAVYSWCKCGWGLANLKSITGKRDWYSLMLLLLSHGWTPCREENSSL